MLPSWYLKTIRTAIFWKVSDTAQTSVRTTHPGSVIGLTDNPMDANKLLIAFQSGLIVLWDLRNKCAEIRWQSAYPLKSVSWHSEGKYFISSHSDGSICTWPMRPIAKPHNHLYPHAKAKQDGKLEVCKPIYKVDLKTTKIGQVVQEQKCAYIIFNDNSKRMKCKN